MKKSFTRQLSQSCALLAVISLFYSTAFTQFLTCTDIYDGVNLFPAGDFEEVIDLLGSSDWANEPDCWVRLSNPDVVNDAYNAIEEQSIETRGSMLIDIPLAEGLWTELHQPVQPGVDYVVSCMLKSGSVAWPLTNNPEWGIQFMFDNEDFANVILPFPNLTPLPVSGLPFNPIPGQFDAGVALFHNEPYILNPAQNSVVHGSNWFESNLEFTTGNTFDNVMFFPHINNSMNTMHYPRIDGVSIIPVSENPISISIVNDPLPTYDYERNVSCGEIFEIRYNIATSFVGQNTDFIFFEVDIPDFLQIIDSAEPNSFTTDGLAIATIGALDNGGVEYTLHLEQNGPMNPGDIDLITIGVHPGSPGGYLSHVPTASLTHEAFCVFDMNHDGKVSIADLTVFLEFFGQPVLPSCGYGDNNGNGVIDANDFTNFLGAFGTECD